ncbi:hypothetical protein [Sphingobacterium humi]|uniref:Uncharacterized protein n=1 Tax=Sphingobacterium humi TaxID=1796905 RepID=A0A6N8L7X7_9SPHI|nr:hypothetical protein [Sphingobacterium humi]MVZ63852.1 hypothetical protein [Sphingobacterium humi]
MKKLMFLNTSQLKRIVEKKLPVVIKANYSKPLLRISLMLSFLILLVYSHLFFTSTKMYEPIIVETPKRNGIHSFFPAMNSVPKAGLEYLRIQQFCQYMDSLSHSVAGRSKLDSIMKKHPGLLDSAKLILFNYKILEHEF